MNGPVLSPPLVMLTEDEASQVPRVDAIEAAHPGTEIQKGQFGTWEALDPGLLGDGVIVRHQLRELLDRLDELYGPPG